MANWFKSNYDNGLLALSINGAGCISLWDTPEDARCGKDSTEVSFNLELTPEQVAVIERARDVAVEVLG